MKKLILLLIITIPLFATDSIYTWGYGYIFKEILESVKMVTNDNQVMLATAISVGGLLVMIKNMQGGSEAGYALMKYMIIVTLIVGMFFEAKKDYVVEDEITQETYAVQDVPVGIGEIFSIFTDLERVLGHGFETAFSTPNSISYTKAGIGFSMAAHLNTDELRVKDTYFTRTFNDYVGNCIISAIINKDISADVILNSSDLMSDLRIEGFESVWYDKDHADGEEDSCEYIWDEKLSDKMDGIADEQISVLAKRAQLDEDGYKDGITGTSDLLFGIGANAKDYLIQQTLKNMTKDGLVVAAQATGGDAATVAYGAAMAQVNQQQQWQLTGILAKDNIPLMKAVITVLILGIFVLLVILSVVFGDIGHIKMGFTLLFAMVLWTPLAIIINAMFYMILEFVVQPSLNGDWITIVNAPTMNDKIKNYMSFLGYLTASIPVLAYAIAKKSEQGFVNFFSGVGGASASSAGTGAGQTSSGNISTGNTRVNMTSVTDVNGTHSYLGNQNWDNKQLRTDSNGNTFMQTSYNDQNGNAMQESKGSNGDLRANNAGELTNITSSTLGMNSRQDTTKAHNESQSVMVQKSEQYGSSIAHNMMKQWNTGSMDITNEAFQTGSNLSKSDSETLTKMTQSSISTALKDLVDKGHKLEITDQATGKVGATIGFDSEKSAMGSLFGMATGISVKADGGLTLTGISSDGKSTSISLSAEEAKAFNESFAKNEAKAFSENQTFAYSQATQHQSTGVFSGGDTATAALQYASSYQKNEALSKLDSIANTQGTSFSEDLLPKLVNGFIDNSPDLKSIKDGGDGIMAGNEALERIKTALDDPFHHTMDYNNIMKSMDAISGTNTDAISKNIKENIPNVNEAINTFDTNSKDYQQEVNQKNSNVVDKTNNHPQEQYNANNDNFKDIAKNEMQKFHTDNNIETKDNISSTKEHLTQEHIAKQDNNQAVNVLKNTGNNMKNIVNDLKEDIEDIKNNIKD